MKNLSPQEFIDKYGTQEYNMSNMVANYQPPKAGLFQRIGQDIQSAGEQVNSLANSAEGSTLNRATGMVSAAFGAIPKVASEFLPEGGRKAVEAVGSGMSSAINFLGEKLGNVGAVHNFVINHPEAAQKLIDALGVTQNLGQISGTILGTGGATSLAESAASKVSSGVKSAVNSLSEGVPTLGKAAEAPNVVEKLVTPQLRGKALEKAIKTGKVTEGEGLFGERDFSGTVPNLEEMKQAVSKVPGINETKTNLEAANLIKAHNDSVHADLMSRLEKEKAITNPSIIKSRMNEVRSTLEEAPTMVGDAAAAGEKIIKKFESLIPQYGYNGWGVMKARIALDKWAGAGKKFSTAAENGATAALRAVRDAGNEIAAELSPNTETKALLKEQTMLHRANDIIAPKAAREGSTKVQQFIKKNPILTKAAKIGTAGTIAGKAAGLVK